MRFTDDEQNELLESPEALTVIVDYHSHMETLAEATDYIDSARYHKERGAEFRALRMKAEEERAMRHEGSKPKR